jgi:hypothetical protein
MNVVMNTLCDWLLFSTTIIQELSRAEKIYLAADIITLANKQMNLYCLSFPDLIGESSLSSRCWIVRSSRTMTIL